MRLRGCFVEADGAPLVLVIDDHPDNRTYLATVLGYAGYKTLEAAEGETGLQLMRASSPDVAIVDMLMPGIDGFEVVRRTRSDPALAPTRIILHSATYREDDLRRIGDPIGNIAILPKPADPDDVLRAVADVLSAPVPARGVTPSEELAAAGHAYEALVAATLAEKISELETAQERLTRIIETVDDGICEVNGDGLTTYVNGAACAILDVPREELIGRDIHATVHGIGPDGRPCTTKTCPVHLTLADGVPRSTSGWTFRRPDGSEFPVEWSVNSVVVGGSIVGGIVTFRDISARRAAATLRIAAEAAAQASQAKSEFLARMSHELRTPLNAILGFGQLLELSSLDGEQAESVHHIRRAGAHLLDLVSDVLDISRVESGQLTISVEPVEARREVVDAVELIAPLASARAVTVRVADDEAWVMADRQRLRQVLINLLSNAVKYNRQGGTVDVSAATSDGSVRIEVRDTGIGLAPSAVTRLFTPFERLGAEGGDVEGTGLGLSLSKAIIEAMGGQIGAESVLHTGSTFWIELPAAAPTEGADSSTPSLTIQAVPTAPTGAAVLYVEDNPSNITLVERIFRLRPAIDLAVAPQGSIALDLVARRRFDLVLLDLHLPDMTGEEVLARLRADPATAGTPVVMLSAEASPATIARLLDDGATAYLAKPIDIPALLQVVDEAVGSPDRGEAAVEG